MVSKLRAYNLQDQGEIRCRRTRISFPRILAKVPKRGAQILQDLGVTSLRLMTNNPAKYNGLSGYGLEVTGRVPLFAPITLENKGISTLNA